MRSSRKLVIVTLALSLVTGLGKDATENRSTIINSSGLGHNATSTTNVSPSNTSTSMTTSWVTSTTEPSDSATTPGTMELLLLSDMKNGGYFLFPVSAIFIVVDGFLVGIVCKNWERISDSLYYNSCLFCLFLTSADLALSLLVGLPIGIRLSFEEQLRENSGLADYTEKIGFLLFEYLFLLRMMIITVLSAEKCLHIFRPLKYMMIATKRRIKIACGVIAVLPLLRIVPLIIALLDGNSVKVNCIDYIEVGKDEWDGSKLVPLRCDLEILRKATLGLHQAEMIIPGIMSGISWLIILVCNLTILLLVVQKSSGHYTIQQRAEMNRKLIKSCIVIMLITVSFALTNFPLTYIRIATYLYQQNVEKWAEVSHRVQFYLILLTYFSLFFHPWLHVLRMRSIKELVIGIKKKICNLGPGTQSSRAASSPNIQFGIRKSYPIMPVSNKSTTLIKKDSPALGQRRKETNPTLNCLREGAETSKV